MRLHLFNPENDLALAADTVSYTPPKTVMEFRTALAALPAWIAEPGDNIIAPAVSEQWLHDNGLEVGTRPEGTPAPWGWSGYAVRCFRRMGISGPFPDVGRLRGLSARSSALYHRLEQLLPYPMPPAPIELRNPDELPDTDRIMLKLPWSCSGRGVVDCEGLTSAQIRRRACDGIRTQGYVMIEPKLKKIQDFAMLFNGGKYAGLSVFKTEGTAYAGNIVAPQPELEKMLGVPYLKETAAAVEASLPEGYDGPVGVDMMLYEGADGSTLIYPAVEMNLRLTMGFVALSLAERFGRGFFRIARGAQPGLQLVPPGGRFSAVLSR